MENRLRGFNARFYNPRNLMTIKDERIGFRVSRETKLALSQIAQKEGRSLAQICELLLKGGIHEYEKEGSKYLHRFVEKTRERVK